MLEDITMMKTVLASAVAAASIMVCGSLSAQLKYDYLEGGYAFTDLDEIGDGSGISVGLSWSPIQNVFLFGDGQWSSVDFDKIFDDVDGDFFRGSIGAGLYLPLSANFDIVGKAGWGFKELDVDSIADSFDGNGVEFEIGVRTLLGEKLELGAFIGWSDIENLSDEDLDVDLGDVAFDVYGIFHLSQTFGLGLETTLQDNSSEIGAFLRLHF